jgi:hypothetical protein
MTADIPTATAPACQWVRLQPICPNAGPDSVAHSDVAAAETRVNYRSHKPRRITALEGARRPRNGQTSSRR